MSGPADFDPDKPDPGFDSRPDESRLSEIVVTVAGVRLTPAEVALPASGRSVRLDLRYLLVVPFVIGAGIGLLDMDLTPFYWAVIVCAAVAIVCLIWARWLRGRYGRTHAETRYGGQALDWRLDETEIRLTGPFLEMAIPWSGFANVVRGEAAFNFLMTPVSMLVLPRRTLTSTQVGEVDALIDRARSRGLIGIAPAELTPSWSDIRDAVAERGQD